MATQTKVELIDDVTGDKADETVLFGIDGREFEIDLTREWARANGHNVSDRGRIPLEVTKAFEDAHRD